jgi:cytoskeletal protein CcmA (bactofilin family)
MYLALVVYQIVLLLTLPKHADRAIPPTEGDNMFNRDGMFTKKDEQRQRDAKAVNMTPGLHTPPAGRDPSEAPKTDNPPTEIKPQVKTEDGKGSKLIVGPDIKLKGAEITDCDTLVVEGRVEAAMDSRVMKIAEGGVFAGTVGIDIAEIHGRFEGELTARKQLIVRSTGKVSGKIRYGKIMVEEGGEVSGDVCALSGVPTTVPSKSAVTTHADPAADIVTAYDPFGRKVAKPGSGKSPSSPLLNP